MRRRTMCALAVTTAALLSGCAATGPVATDGCEWTRPILVSREDRLSEGTAEAILTHNLTGAQVCGWRPAKAGDPSRSDRHPDS